MKEGGLLLDKCCNKAKEKGLATSYDDSREKDRPYSNILGGGGGGKREKKERHAEEDTVLYTYRRPGEILDSADVEPARSTVIEMDGDFSSPNAPRGTCGTAEVSS